MKRTDRVTSVLNHFIRIALPSLAGADSRVIDTFERCRCRVEVNLTEALLFCTMANLMDAAWVLGAEAGLDMDIDAESDWGKDINEFIQQLTEPWPVKELKSIGATVVLHKPGKWNQKHLFEYKFSIFRATSDS